MMTTKQHQRPAICQNVLFISFGALLVFFFAFSSCNAARTTTAHHQRDSSGEQGGLWVPQQHEPTDLQAPYRSLLFLRGGSGRRQQQQQQQRASRLLDYYSSCNYVWDETTNGYICQPNNKTEPLWIVIPSLLVGIAILITCCRCIYIQRQQQDALAQQQHQLVLTQQRQHNNNNYGNASNLNTESRLVTAATISQRSSPNARAGVGFVGKDYAKITRIQHDSILHGSELVPGMKVVSINNISIGSARQAAEVIATVMVLKDVLTILAHSPGYYGSTENYVTATAVKERPDQPLGITYKKEFSHGPIRLGNISETSLLIQSSQHGTASTSGTELTPGMEVVAVNNVPVQSLAQVTEITRSAFPLVTILARRSAAVVVAVMESSNITGGSNVPIVAKPISQSYAIGDEPLAVATATTTITMIEEEDRGSSIEL